MKTRLEELSKSTKVFFLIGFSVLLFVVTKSVTGRWLPTAEDGMWFQFGLLLVVLGSFFLEAHFSKPNDVIINSIAVLVTLLALRERSGFIGWHIMVIISVLLLGFSVLTLILFNKERSDLVLRNKIAKVFYHVSTFAGQGRLFFSIIFLLAIASYYTTRSDNFIKLLLFWGIIIIIQPSGLANLVNRITLTIKAKTQNIGTIIGIVSPNVVIAKLNERAKIKKFDLVAIRLSTGSPNDEIGLILGDYLLQNERWIRIVTVDGLKYENPETDRTSEKSILYKKGDVCKLTEPEIANILEEKYVWKNRKNIVGIVTEGSDIGQIKFEVIAHPNTKLEEGMLLKALVDDDEIIYQITNGITDKEILKKESEIGFVRGVAQQLGLWNSSKSGFDRYGWVPNLNSILYLVSSEEKVNYTLESDELLLGHIPRSQYPVVYKVKDLVSHHTAILGITGSGKTWLAYTLIQEMINRKTKVICIDFTGKYKKDMSMLEPKILIPEENIDNINKILEGIEDLKASCFNYKNKISQIYSNISKVVQTFMEEDNHLAIFELPDISNTFSVLEFTQLFLQAVFEYAKGHEDKQICLVLEEAHTVIPEQATLGIGGDFGRSRGIVGKISQIALQGRKYSVGFLVIAQRTANVTKTVLNQCNSIISFNAFDNTSMEFLKNYLGVNMVNVLPNLKAYQAVTVGKAFKSKNPVIVQIKERTDPFLT